MPATVEILGPSGHCLYTKTAADPLVASALRTPGYAVRWPGVQDMRVLEELPGNCKATLTFPKEGLTAACPDEMPRPCSHCGVVHLPGCNVHCDY